MNWLETLLFAIVAIVALSLLYKFLPARALPAGRPRFVIFPKYQFHFADMDDLAKNLKRDGFTQKTATHYVRGSYFGDFLASLVKLEVKIDADAKTAILQSPLSVIAFDTGDLWDIAKGLQTN